MTGYIGRHAKLAGGLLAATVAAVSLGAGISGASTSSHTSAHKSRGVKPTIVFVHGGWADSSGWNKEITRLQKRGYSVIAPANPLRALGSATPTAERSSATPPSACRT